MANSKGPRLTAILGGRDSGAAVGVLLGGSLLDVVLQVGQDDGVRPAEVVGVLDGVHVDGHLDGKLRADRRQRQGTRRGGSRPAQQTLEVGGVSGGQRVWVVAGSWWSTRCCCGGCRLSKALQQCHASNPPIVDLEPLLVAARPVASRDSRPLFVASVSRQCSKRTRTCEPSCLQSIKFTATQVFRRVGRRVAVCHYYKRQNVDRQGRIRVLVPPNSREAIPVYIVSR